MASLGRYLAVVLTIVMGVFYELRRNGANAVISSRALGEPVGKDPTLVNSHLIRTHHHQLDA